VEYGRRSENIHAIYVSTDDDEITIHAKNLGVSVIRRGSELAGERPVVDVYRHALHEIGDDRITHVVGIQPDHPDRKTDLNEAISYVLRNNIDDLFTVDRHGIRNGALRILSKKALEAQPSLYSSVIMDDCVNIHNHYDFKMAMYNIEREEPIRVGKFSIGVNEPVFIVAEAACNHMCDMSLARKMIDLAVEAGVSAIKFQTYKAEKLVTTNAVAFWGNEQISQLEYYKRLDRFGRKEYEEIFHYAERKGIVAFSSPFDEESTQMLADLGMPLFKIASCDICNLRHLKQVADYGKPIILSTGASTPKEIDQAVETIFSCGNHQLILLACTLSYPTKNENANLMRIKTLQERYPGVPIGLSDHTEPDKHMVIPALAVALGAKVIEKHYTLDRSMTGSGHFFAVDPHSLKNMIENIRLAEIVMGRGDLTVTLPEQKAWISARRSIVAEERICAGEVITQKMLGLKRPGNGLSGDMMKKVAGRRAKKDIEPDEQIQLDMLE
jgi:N-acetylneuraminate synthase